jgi:hypothetical protein
MDTESWETSAEVMICEPVVQSDGMGSALDQDCPDLTLERLVATAVHRLIAALSIVAGPRQPRGRRHCVMNVLMIAVLGCVCGSDNADALEEWAVK